LVVAAVLAMIVSVVGWATAVAAQAPSCLRTSDRMPGPHAFAGAGIKARAPVYTDARQFVAGGQTGRLDAPYVVREADALNSEGFVSGTGQHYFGKATRFAKRVERSRGSWLTPNPGDGAARTGPTDRDARDHNGGDVGAMQLGSPEQAQAQLNRSLAGIVRK